MKKDTGYHILRVGMGITFLWIGVLILSDPISWLGFLPPWMIEMIPVDLTLFMQAVGILDLVLGFLMLTDKWMWQVNLVASLHLLGILVAGIDAITVRDIGLLGGTIALMWADLPEKHKKKVMPH